MESPARISVSTLGDHKPNQLSTSSLSPNWASSLSPDGPPASPRLSISSTQSGTTQVEDERDFELPAKKKTGYKVITSDIQVKITYWESLKSVFMPWQNGTRKVTAEIQVVDPDEETEDTESFCSPWIRSVSVLSKERDSTNRFVQKEAQCTIDTANLQGNLVSRDFLLTELGYHESEFMGKGLKKSDKNGVSVSGHEVIPDGAVKLTWYHSNSPRVFRHMRFLVVPNPLCELVLGARVIQKYGILNPPNFQNGVVLVSNTKYPTFLELNKRKEELGEQIGELNRQIKKSKDKKEIADLTEEKKPLEEELSDVLKSWTPEKKKKDEAEQKIKDEAERKKKEEEDKTDPETKTRQA